MIERRSSPSPEASTRSATSLAIWRISRARFTRTAMRRKILDQYEAQQRRQRP